MGESHYWTGRAHSMLYCSYETDATSIRCSMQASLTRTSGVGKSHDKTRRANIMLSITNKHVSWALGWVCFTKRLDAPMHMRFSITHKNICWTLELVSW